MSEHNLTFRLEKGGPSRELQFGYGNRYTTYCSGLVFDAGISRWVICGTERGEMGRKWRKKAVVFMLRAARRRRRRRNAPKSHDFCRIKSMSDI